MALVTLQDANWTLTDKRQDIRGRELRDAVGRALGIIEHMIVDTEQERVVSVRLKDATEYAADALQIMEDAVYYIPPDTPPVSPTVDATTEPGEAAHPAPVADAAVGEEVAVEEDRLDAADDPVPDPSMTAPAIAVPPSDPAIPAPPDAEAADDPQPAPGAEPQAPGAYLDADFRSHFESGYATRRLSYADLQFAYRFGFDAARTPPLADRKLPGVEDNLRRVFYARFNYPASDTLVWSVAGDAVREGFRLGKR